MSEHRSSEQEGTEQTERRLGEDYPSLFSLFPPVRKVIGVRTTYPMLPALTKADVNLLVSPRLDVTGGYVNARKQTGRNAVASRYRIPFLTAHWRWLVVVNYEVDPSVLRSYLPCGTELDLFQDTCLASIVGFLFQRTRLFGRLAVPLHASFEEVNLRFYVKRHVDGRARRGVVFIKELVPSRSVTCVARTLFHENYERAPTRHLITWNDPSSPERGGEFHYRWRIAGQWSQLCAKTCGPRDNLVSGSMAEFITEHYWGYSRRRDGTTCEYAVEHPRWQVWPVESCSFETDIEALYGPHFVRPLSAAFHSALVAQGSPIVLYRGARV